MGCGVRRVRGWGDRGERGAGGFGAGAVARVLQEEEVVVAVARVLQGE